MTVEIISRSISTKVWYRAGIEVASRAATFTKFGKRLHEFQQPKRFRLNVTSRFNFYNYADR